MPEASDKKIALANEPGQAEFPPNINSNLELMFGEMRAGNKIAAIKIFRETYNASLAEAKDAVEKLEKGLEINVSGKPLKMPLPLPVISGHQNNKGCFILLLLIVLPVVFLLGKLFFKNTLIVLSVNFVSPVFDFSFVRAIFKFRFLKTFRIYDRRRQ